MSMYDDLVKAIAALPPNPVAPENRNFARLQPSAYAPRGQVFRLLPDPAICMSFDCKEHKPMIVMNDEDVNVLRRVVGNWPPWVADQWIADACEQVFAEREARGL